GVRVPRRTVVRQVPRRPHQLLPGHGSPGVVASARGRRTRTHSRSRHQPATPDPRRLLFDTDSACRTGAQADAGFGRWGRLRHRSGLGPVGHLSCRIVGGASRRPERGASPGQGASHRTPRCTEPGRTTHVRKVMPMIDLALARQHLKIDEGDTTEDTLVTQYTNSATSACEGYCNRKFYVDQDALDADYVVARTALENAR